MASLVSVTQVVLAVGHGVFRDDFEVAVGDQVVEGLGRLLLVHGVGVDGGAHDVEIFLEDGLAGVLDGGDIAGDGKRGQDADDGHDDHQLDEREARGRALAELARRGGLAALRACSRS